MKKKVFLGFLTLMLCLLVTACENNEEDMIIQLENENDSTVMVPKAVSEEEYDMSFTEYDDKFVWSVGETSIIYYHNKENVTDFETYIKFNSEEEAVEFYDNNKDAILVEENGIKEVLLKNNYVIVKYNIDQCEYKTYNELKEAYELFKNMYNDDLDGMVEE